jgi:hypothetical protein
MSEKKRDEQKDCSQHSFYTVRNQLSHVIQPRFAPIPNHENYKHEGRKNDLHGVFNHQFACVLPCSAEELSEVSHSGTYMPNWYILQLLSSEGMPIGLSEICSEERKENREPVRIACSFALGASP